jgi:hypothetical protein
MTLRDFEAVVLEELKKVVKAIIEDNLYLNISAKARAGAEISDFLENKFVEYTHKNVYFKNSESAPKWQTKNPWDVRTFFVLNSLIEEIWIDFKAFKITSADSNPDIGTPNKIINFIKKGFFYLTYVYVFYQEKGDGIEFVYHNETYTKLYFLKDISPTFRRNPKNQLQVNISEPTVYRTREEFIILLMEKLKESHQRQIAISTQILQELNETGDELLSINRKSEKRILKNL